MPIKLVPPRKSPYWSVRGTHLGVYVNRSTKVSERAIAAKVLKEIRLEIQRGEFTQRTGPTFASAATAYMRDDGERTYLTKLLRHFGETPIGKIDQAAVDAAADALYRNASPATRNRQVYTPVSAVLRHAGCRVDLRRPKGSMGNKQTGWLWPEEAHRLFEEAEKLDSEFAALLIVLCYTGLRLSEALDLTWNNVRLQEGYAYIPDTKTGVPRSAFLPPVAVAAIANRERANSRDTVFSLRKGGHLYSLLRVAAIRAEVSLPERSAFHILRHTYATWMRRYGGADEAALIATGAWKDKKSVARYTHAVVSEEAKRATMLPTPPIKKAI